MVSRLFLLLVAAAAVTQAQNGTEVAPDCELLIEQCVSQTATALRNAILKQQFDHNICAQYANISGCYNLAASWPECANYTSTLQTINATNQVQTDIMCPKGQISTCLTGLKSCVDIYNITPNTSVQLQCRAASDAATCVANLTCEGALDVMKNKFLQQVSIGAATCMANNTNATECERKAAGCITPIEKRLFDDEQAYNYDDLCGLWPEIQKCFNSLKADNNCSSVQQTLSNTMTTFTNRYHQYCDVNNKPLPCMENLAQCTQAYQTLSQLPMYKNGDVLLYCQGLKTLTACMDQVGKQLRTCPALTSAQAVTSRKQEQAEYQAACDPVMTACTSTAIQCIIPKSLLMQSALDSYEFDKYCYLAADSRKCLDPYITNLQCKGGNNGLLLTNETTYLDNVTAVYCGAKDIVNANPCLKGVQQCVSDNSKKVNNPSLNSTFCGNSVSMTKCLAAVNCPSTLQSVKDNAAKTAAQPCPTASPGGAAQVTVSLTLMIAAILKVTLVWLRFTD